MNFTAKVFKLESASGSLKGFAKVTINDVITTDGWKIFEGSNGLFVSPPSTKKEKDGEVSWPATIFFEDFNTETKTSVVKSKIEEVVLAAYRGDQDDTRKQAAGARKKANW